VSASDFGEGGPFSDFRILFRGSGKIRCQYKAMTMRSIHVQGIQTGRCGGVHLSPIPCLRTVQNLSNVTVILISRCYCHWAHIRRCHSMTPNFMGGKKRAPGGASGVYCTEDRHRVDEDVDIYDLRIGGYTPGSTNSRVHLSRLERTSNWTGGNERFEIRKTEVSQRCLSINKLLFVR